MRGTRLGSGDRPFRVGSCLYGHLNDSSPAEGTWKPVQGRGASPDFRPADDSTEGLSGGREKDPAPIRSNKPMNHFFAQNPGKNMPPFLAVIPLLAFLGSASALAETQHRAQAKAIYQAYLDRHGGAAAALAAAPPDLGTHLQACQACHGPDGNSIHVKIPSLAEQNPRYLIEQLLTFQDRKRQPSIMHAYADALDNDQMAAMALQFAALPRRLTVKPDPDKAQAGEALYQALCRHCHGSDGTGAGEVYANLRAQRADYLALSLHRFQGTGIGRSSHEMALATRGLSAAEIESLAHYLAGL